MRQNTWILVLMAIAFTASAVIAKSFISKPSRVDAVPKAPTAPVKLNQVIEIDRPEEISEAPAAQRHPLQPAGIPERSAAREKQWTVTVVRGTDVESVDYNDCKTKAIVPGLN